MSSPAFAIRSLYLVPPSPPSPRRATTRRSPQPFPPHFQPSTPRRRKRPAAPHPRPAAPAPSATPPSAPLPPPPGRHGALWQRRFAELAAFAARNGHCAVPRHDAEHAALYRWVCSQRHEWRRGKLLPTQFRSLSALPGFSWDCHYEQWKLLFFELVAFREEHGHTCVPLRRHVPGDPHERLARWVAKQRYLAKHGILPDDRRRRLDGLHFAFTLEDSHFEARLKQLRSLKAKYGHANLPPSWPEDPSLARWAEDARRRWRKGKLVVCHQRALLEAGFSFAPNADLEWDAHYSALAQFVAIHKKCLPQFIEDPSLSRWLSKQGKSYENGALSEARMSKLSALGVDFRPWREVFQERFDALKAFYIAQGHHSYPNGSFEELWACQLRGRGRNQLSVSHLKALEDIRFDWASNG